MHIKDAHDQVLQPRRNRLRQIEGVTNHRVHRLRAELESRAFPARQHAGHFDLEDTDVQMSKSEPRAYTHRIMTALPP
jgi:hypothetical protein